MNRISIIGGDLRIAYLAEILSNDNYEVFTYGLEKSEIIIENTKIHKCNSLEEISDMASIVISSIPLTRDGININTPLSDKKISIEEVTKILDGKLFLAGKIEKEIQAELPHTKIVDLLENEELTVLNAIASAEGTIQVAMQETNITLHESNILITGFGRITKVLFNMLKGFGANIYCETTKQENLSWIRAYGYTPILLEELNNNLGKFDLIINTVPHIILDKTNLNLLKKDCVIVDVASAPGGVDREEAKKQDIETIWVLGLPGKVAPYTAAKYIKETLDNIIKEN